MRRREILRGAASLALLAGGLTLRPCVADAAPLSHDAFASPDAPASRDTRVARIAFMSAINSLDPVMTIESLPLFRSIFDALTDTAPDGALRPRLAESWTSADLGRSWIFRVRAGAVWSDGTPVTADDVLYTVRKILASPVSLNRNYLEAIAAVARSGPRDVLFTLKRPVAAWPRQMTLISIVPERAYQKLGPAGFAAHPVGSGPYSVSQWDRAGNLTLVANPHYWGGVPDIGTVTVVPLPDSVARLNGLLSGELDVIPLAPQQVALARNRANIAVETVASNRVAYLGFNVSDPVLADTGLRHAIDCAIDRPSIARYLLDGLAQPTGSLVAPATFGFDATLQPTSYDPARARRLVAASSYRGTPIQFDYATDGTVPLGSQVAQAIGGYLEAVGIHVKLHGVDQRSLIADWITHRFPGFYMFTYAPSTMDASLVTGSLIGPNGARYFTDSSMDALEHAQQAEADPVVRAHLFAEILRRSDEHVYYAPLLSDSYSFAIRTDKVSFTPRADGYVFAQDLHTPRS